MDSRTLLAELDGHYRAMPPVAALQLEPATFDGEALRLRAPLSANVNDKGCAFGGSLVSLMTLAGWGLVTMKLREAGYEADVYVADSQVRYRAPLYDDLVASARLEDVDTWAAALEGFKRGGRLSVQVVARVRMPNGADAVRLQARYVAIARESGRQASTPVRSAA